MTDAALARRLGPGDAVFIGLGSMIGAGVFAAFAPAATAAGSGLLVGLAIAAVVAVGNATSSAQLAAAHPTSGGTYAYGRAELGPWWGFIAGWGFVVGKLASCAAMALTFASYVVPEPWQRPVGILAVALVAGVDLLGVTRTAMLARLIVTAVLLVLAVVVVAAVGAPDAPGWLDGPGLWSHGPYGILQSAGLLFFAFAGYARIATMGEEVRNPSRTIPLAIVVALSIALVVYLAVAIMLLSTLGPAALAASGAPLADAMTAARQDWALPLVGIGAAAASLGALLALVAGVGRTIFAMAREGDLPSAFAAVHPRSRVPHRAEIAVAIVVVAAVALVDLRGAIGFSSFGVLVYYLVANIAAFRQRRPARRYPRALQVVGAAGCVVLVATLPWQSVVAGVAVFAVGVAYRLVRLRATRAA